MDEVVVTASAVGDSTNDVGSAAAAAFSESGQLRRVTLGGGTGRRDSLGLDAIGDALFGRRPSGFGMDLDGGFGGGAMMGRRGSMDSTTAALDAAIMDLTRRRLSMAMGGDTFGGGAGGFNDPLMGMTSGMNPIGMQFNMNMGGGLGSHMGGGLGNQLGGGLGNQLGGGLGSHIGAMAGIGSASGAGTSGPSMASAAASNAVNSINVRQQQLQDQQRELERRQKELELQRQQLLTAMEERRRVMQQMQQNMGQGPPGGSAVAAAAAQRTNSLLGSIGAGGLGANPGSLGAGGFGVGNLSTGGLGASTGGLMGSGSGRPGGQEWFVCSICNSKAFSNREEAFAHETICLQSLGGAYRRNSGMEMRRSSLDLLGALAGGSSPSALGSTPDRLRQQLRDVEQGRRGSDPTSENQVTTLSNGPFTVMDSPLPLAMTADKDWLTPLHCFVRRHCVEVFTASDSDVATPSKGKRKPIHVGQVGIRCPHCRTTLDDSAKSRERGSVYYPTTIASIYNATMNLLQRHLHNCSSVPDDIMRRYDTLKADDARSGTSKKYWVESALSLGLVDTPTGIRFSALRPPPLPTLTSQQRSSGNYSAARGNDDDFFNSSSNALTDLSQRDSSQEDSQRSEDDDVPAPSGKESELEKIEISGNSKDEDNESGEAAKSGGDINIPFTEQSLTSSAPLVTPEDEPYSTAFSFHLLSQMQPCVFTEADRLGKRKGLPPGFPGLACRHCFGGYGSGRFFPSSIKTLSDTSKTLNVLHNHMMRCRKCPAEVRETLDSLRKEHDEERAKMKFGSQKAFFARIWDRLHYKDPTVGPKRKFQQPSQAPARKQQRSTPRAVGNFAAAGSHFSHPGPSYFEPSNSFPGGLAGLSAGLGGGLHGGLAGGYQNNSMLDTLAMHYAAGDLLGSNTRRKLQDLAESSLT